MSDEDMVVKIMPGDTIEWDIECSSQARLEHIWATFVFDEGDAPPRKLVLGGSVHRFSKRAADRSNFATLTYDDEHSDELAVGNYRLTSMNGITGSGASRDFEDSTLPPAIIRVEPEPENESLRLRGTYIRTV